jgi:hypothetical protein
MGAWMFFLGHSRSPAPLSARRTSPPACAASRARTFTAPSALQHCTAKARAARTSLPPMRCAPHNWRHLHAYLLSALPSPTRTSHTCQSESGAAKAKAAAATAAAAAAAASGKAAVDSDDDDHSGDGAAGPRAHALAPQLSAECDASDFRRFSPDWFVERAKFIPVRLDLRERKRVRVLSFAMNFIKRIFLVCRTQSASTHTYLPACRSH